MDFEKEYPFDNIFTKPEIINVRSIPYLKTPKTIEPIHAITKNTPLERVGKLFKPTTADEEVEDEEESIEGEEYEEESVTDVEQGTPKE
jgi:hypothetical protein